MGCLYSPIVPEACPHSAALSSDKEPVGCRTAGDVVLLQAFSSLRLGHEWSWSLESFLFHLPVPHASTSQPERDRVEFGLWNKGVKGCS